MGRKLIEDFTQYKEENGVPKRVARYFYPNKYEPHQGSKEKAKRVRKLSKVS